MEYKIVEFKPQDNIERKINELAKQGWRIVNVDKMKFLLSRVVEDKVVTKPMKGRKTKKKIGG